MSETTETGSTSRRAVLAGATGAGAAAFLAACGSTADNNQPSGNTGNNNPANNSATKTTGAPSGGTTGGISKSEIPVGGGKVLKAEKAVIAQPRAGTFVAFTSVCTHAGCDVSKVENNIIECACHGSQYSATDGTVKKGPATKALAKKNLKVQGDELIL